MCASIVMVIESDSNYPLALSWGIAFNFPNDSYNVLQQETSEYRVIEECVELWWCWIWTLIALLYSSMRDKAKGRGRRKGVGGVESNGARAQWDDSNNSRTSPMGIIKEGNENRKEARENLSQHQKDGWGRQHFTPVSVNNEKLDLTSHIGANDFGCGWCDTKGGPNRLHTPHSHCATMKRRTVMIYNMQ